MAGNGRFRKGHKKIGGRKKGTPNQSTSDIKEAALAAFTELGADGHGKDGLKGYFKRIGRKDVRTAAMLLRAILPMQVNLGKPEEPKIYKTAEEVREELRRRGIPIPESFFQLQFHGPEDLEELGILPPETTQS